MLQMMRFRPLTFIGTLIAVLIPMHSWAGAQTNTRQSHTPVLVELFTAEGCSSCPPADTLLARLESEQPIPGVQIIVLGEHVDYWDQLGWRDRFSSPLLTERQHGYGFRLKVNDIYTPQMVVDGTEQFVGSDAAHALSAITRARQTTKIALALSKPIIDGRRIAITVCLAAPSSTHPKADLYAALVDPSDTTDVGGGENQGRHLHHIAVVRALQRIGKLNNLGSAPVKTTLNVPPGAIPGNMRVVIFAQGPGTGAIVGAAQSQ